MSNETLPATTKEMLAGCKKIDAMIAKCTMNALAQAGQTERGVMLAEGVKFLRKAFDGPYLDAIMELQGSSLGFRTDKDSSGGYSREQVKECAIEAQLRGVYTTGNEMNIIAAKPYVTKEGFARLCREFPGFTDLKTKFGIPKIVPSGAIVVGSASWKLNGVRDSINNQEFAIKVNKMMGSDAILGKATRKLSALIYGRLTGSEMTMPEGEVGDVIDVDLAEPATISIDDLKPAAPEPPAKAAKAKPAPTPTEEPEKPVEATVEAPAAAQAMHPDTFDSLEGCTDKNLANHVYLQAMAAGWTADGFIKKYETLCGGGMSPQEALADMMAKFDKAK